MTLTSDLVTPKSIWEINCANDTCKQQDGFCLFGCVNGSECKDGLSTTSIIETTKIEPISTTFPTQFTASDRTLTTKTTTEISVETDHGDRSTLIVIIIIVTVAMLALCTGIIVYCICKRKKSSKSGDGTVVEHEYTNVYAEIGNVDYKEAVTIPRQSGNFIGPDTSYDDIENPDSSYDDIENIIECLPSPEAAYQYQDEDAETTSGANEQTATKTPYERSENPENNNRADDSITQKNKHFDPKPGIHALTRERTGRSATERQSTAPVTSTRVSYSPSCGTVSSGYAQVFALSSLSQNTPIAQEICYHGYSESETTSEAIEETATKTRYESSENPRETTGRSATERQSHAPVTSTRVSYSPSCGTVSSGYADVFAVTSSSQKTPNALEICYNGNSESETTSEANEETTTKPRYERSENPENNGKADVSITQKNKHSDPKSGIDALTRETTGRSATERQSLAPVTSTRVSYSSSCGTVSSEYADVFAVSSLSQKKPIVKEICYHGNSKLIFNQNTDNVSEDYCVVEEPTRPTGQGNRGTERESQTSAYADVN